MATRDNGIPRDPITGSRIKQSVHQSEESRIQTMNSQRNEDVVYPSNIPTNQFSKSVNTTSSSTGFSKNPLSTTIGSTRQIPPTAAGDRLLQKSLHEKTLAEKEASSHGGSCVFKEEKVTMKSVLYKFSSVIEENVRAKHSTVSVEFKRNDENAICTLKGTYVDVQNAKVTLQDMEKTLFERKITFPTNTASALRHYSIENIVSDLLKVKYPGCVAQQLKNEVFLYGFDTELVENARMFLSKAIAGKDKLLSGHVRENKQIVVDHFRNRYKNRVVVYVDNICWLHMVGQKEAVEEASCEFVEINEGKKSLPSEDAGSNLHQEVTQCIGPLEPVSFWFLKTSVKLKQVSNYNNVTIYPDEVDYTLTIKGLPENVSRAAKDLHLLKTSIRTDRTNISGPRSMNLFTSALGGQEFDFCMDTYDVLIKKKLTFTCGKLQVTKELHNDISTWSTSGGKLLTVEYFSFKNLTADLKFVMGRRDPNKGGNFKAVAGETVEIAVPDMVNRGKTDLGTIDMILKRAFEKTTDNNAHLVAFLISPFANWDFDSLMKCMVNSFVDWLLKSPKKERYSVLLCTEERSYFSRTDEFIGVCLRNKIEDANVVREQPRVLVMKGHLDQAKADVIVNTADSSLDLSYGKVSSALLKAAGDGLQTECRNYHPNGIKYDDIAVTDGYNLNCKSVFHITLQSQNRSTKGFIQSIRNAMSLCFKTASDYGYKSLAFPAMGTGSLRYPPEEVASEMIMAAERFTSQYSKTSIEEVQFVIFPSDEILLQTFQKMAKELVKPTVQCLVQYDITGLEQNVKDCKTWLSSRGNGSTTGMNFYFTESTDTASARSGLGENSSESRYFENGRSYLCGNITIRVCVADILDAPVYCIVNSANGDLDHCGGIAHGIAEAAGNMLRKESAALIKEKGHLPVASVERTSSGNLTRYKCVLHAVGPDYTDYAPITKSNLDKCEHDLYETICNCLMKASDMKLRSIALPAISSGLFRVPKEVCAIQYAKAVKKFSSTTSSPREVHFVDKSRDMIDILHKTFDAMITHGKPAPFDTSKFIEKTVGVVRSARGGAFKNTARDRSQSVIKDLNISPERVLTINGSYKSNSMKLTCKFEEDAKLEVQVYESDIVNLKDIDAVVCSENRAGNAKGIVARLLLKKGGDEYNQEKASRFNCQPAFGEIITTGGGRNSYNWIMHAIISRKDPNAIPLMYRKIFEEVESKGFTSVALPLLGTGVGDVDPSSCSEMLFGELKQLCQTKRRNAFTLHIVINEKQTADIVKDVFKRSIDEIKKISKADHDTERRDSQPSEKKTALTNKGTAELHEKVEANSDCVICMDTVTDAKTLKCGHMFCAECIEGYFRVKKVCPTCGKVCGTITGDQPDGIMIIGKQLSSVAGFEKYKSIAITYCFKDGTQWSVHPRPGEPYKGIRRSAYLPDNKEGRRICAMLKIAFTRRLVFTIGTSRTTGKECVITWNDIHHKTDMRPNTQFGYPDETYLQRVREELEAKGVTLQDVETELIEELKDDYFKKTFTTDMKI